MYGYGISYRKKNTWRDDGGCVDIFKMCTYSDVYPQIKFIKTYFKMSINYLWFSKFCSSYHL